MVKRRVSYDEPRRSPEERRPNSKRVATKEGCICRCVRPPYLSFECERWAHTTDSFLQVAVSDSIWPARILSRLYRHTHKLGFAETWCLQYDNIMSTTYKSHTFPIWFWATLRIARNPCKRQHQKPDLYPRLVPNYSHVHSNSKYFFDFTYVSIMHPNL